MATPRASRRSKTQRWIVYIVVTVTMVLFGGWMFMLAVGVARHQWLPNLPTVGYRTAVLLAVLTRGALFLPMGSREDVP